MILFTNGCSWTWGSGLELWTAGNHDRRLQLVWPYHLGKLLSAEQVVNLAEGCGSNQRVLRTTYDWLISQSKEVLRETTAVIQLTQLSRFEFYEPITQEQYENLPGQWVKVNANSISGDSIYRSKWDKDHVLEKAKRRMAETRDIENIYRTIGYIYALEGMFKLFEIKNWYIWHMNNSNGWSADFNDTYRAIFNSHFNILDSDQSWIYERISTKDPHPSISGHKQLADIIFNKISI